MAEIGAVTVKVKIDPRSFNVQMARVKRSLYLRIIGQAILGLLGRR